MAAAFGEDGEGPPDLCSVCESPLPHLSRRTEFLCEALHNARCNAIYSSLVSPASEQDDKSCSGDGQVSLDHLGRTTVQSAQEPKVAVFSPHTPISFELSPPLSSSSLNSSFSPTTPDPSFPLPTSSTKQDCQDFFFTTETNFKKVQKLEDALCAISEDFSLNVMRVSVEIRTYFKIIICQLKERERELLTELQEKGEVKIKEFKIQTDYLAKLKNEISVNAGIMKQAVAQGNPESISCAHAIACSRFEKFKNQRPPLNPPCYETIRFVKDDRLGLALADLGQINVRPASPPQALFDKDKNKNPQTINGYMVETTSVANLRMPEVVFGDHGEADGQLSRPWGICCDLFGNLVVADRSNNRIQIFKPDGTFVNKFGGLGSEEGLLDRPTGVTVNSHNNIIVSDKDNHRIQVFTTKGTFLLSFGKKGSQNGEFCYPWDVAVDSCNKIAVSDSKNRRVQLFSPDGAFICKYGFETSPNLIHFDTPRGLCFASDDSLFLTDFGNNCIINIQPNFEKATFFDYDPLVIQMKRPQGIAIDFNGNLVICDSKNNRILILGREEKLLVQFGTPGMSPGELNLPSGVCCTRSGGIAVVDFGNNRIQIF